MSTSACQRVLYSFQPQSRTQTSGVITEKKKRSDLQNTNQDVLPFFTWAASNIVVRQCSIKKMKHVQFVVRKLFLYVLLTERKRTVSYKLFCK
jgi:hypothetical protein